MKHLILPCVLLLLLTGCGTGVSSEPETRETVLSTIAAPEISEEETAAAVPETETESLPEPETTLPLSYDAYQVAYNILEENGEETGTFQGIDPEGNLVWTYHTGSYPQGQMMQISPLGRFQGTYYLLEGGTVIALDIVSGRILFENGDFGGCSSQEVSLIDDYGYLYLCGFDKPDFFAMDPMGHTVKKIGTLDEDHYGPFKITVDGNVLTVHMERDSMGNSGDFPVSIPMDWIPQAKG